MSINNADTGAHALRASQDALDMLHFVVCEVLIDQLRREMTRKNKHGISTRLLSAVCQFLKLNGITTPDASAAKLDELRALMPDFTDEEFIPPEH